MRAVEYCFTTSLNYSKLIVQLKRSCLRHNYHTIRYGQSCAVEPQNAEDLQSPLREDTRPLQEVHIFSLDIFRYSTWLAGGLRANGNQLKASYSTEVLVKRESHGLMPGLGQAVGSQRIPVLSKKYIFFSLDVFRYIVGGRTKSQ